MDAYDDTPALSRFRLEYTAIQQHGYEYTVVSWHPNFDEAATELRRVRQLPHVIRTVLDYN